MAFDWTQEEKTLIHIKKIIILFQRMDSRQQYMFCKKLEQNQDRILSGQLGSVFFQNLKQFTGTGLDAKAWADLQQDTDCLLRLIQKYRDQDENAWRMVLPKLERLQSRHFRTGLGMAFVQTLKEKTDEKSDLEEIALWLMESTQSADKKTKNIRRFFIPVPIKEAAIPVLVCLSAFFLSIWLYGQVERNRSNWDLQQMKAFASKETAAEEFSDSTNLIVQAGSMDYAKKMAQEGQTVQKLQIPDAQQCKFRPKKLPQYKEASEKYPELYGWLKIPDTQIDFPVMKSKREDDFYLHHDFKGNESAEGALFVDAKNSIYPQGSNTVVYGHNMKNGHMFGTLQMFTDADYFRQHRKIYFDTLYEAGEYETVAVLKTRLLNENEQGFRYYRFFQYNNEKEFQKCRKFVEQNRMFETGSVLQYGDNILMLSTCEYSQENGRLVVVAKKL